MVITINTKEIEDALYKYPDVTAVVALSIGGVVGWKLVKAIFGPSVYKFEATSTQLKTLQEFGGRLHYYTKKGEFLLVPIEKTS